VQRSGASSPPVSAAADRRFAVSADFLLLGTVLLWSFNFTAIRYAVTHGFVPLTYAPIRWAIAGTIFAVITWRREGDLRVTRRDLALLVLLAAVGVFVNQISFAYASRLATAATVALLFGTLPVFVALFSHFAGVERFRLRHWVAVACSFSGVALVAVGQGGGISAHAGGVLLALATAATFAAYSVGVVPLMRRHSPYRINAMTGLAGAVLLATAGSSSLADQDWSMSALAWGALLYGALASAAFGNVLWFKGIDRVGPGRAALYVNLQPFLGAVFALIVLSESLNPLQVAGGVVVGAAILIARARPTAAPPAE
jgi:drug/metabolite transporter (DMT)-like permease